MTAFVSFISGLGSRSLAATFPKSSTTHCQLSILTFDSYSIVSALSNILSVTFNVSALL